MLVTGLAGFFGGGGSSFILRQRVSFKLSPMTASVRFYTHSGFLVAADGRQRWTEASSRDAEVRAMESDVTQKIFNVCNDEMSLAYVAIGDIRSRDKSLDINRELREQIRKLRGAKFASCYEYVSAVAAGIEQNILRSRTMDSPETEICFVGYFRGAPCGVTIQFKRYFNELGRLHRVRSESLFPGYCSVNGSLLIGELIDSRDLRLARYAKPLKEDISLDDAAEFSKGYIAACASPLASEIDLGYEHEKVGGHTHMATVTKEGGFKWLIPPKNKLLGALKNLISDALQ